MAGKEVDKPYGRREYSRALALNAALDPFATVLFASLIAVGIVIGKLGLVLPIAVIAYLAAAARTFFDEDQANKVLARERDKRREALESGRVRLDPRALAPPIGDLVQGALQREQRIREAIESADLPYTEAIGEVEAFVSAMETTARRAQLLYEALAEAPPAQVEQRLITLKEQGDPAKAPLVEALTHQLKVGYRMQDQLQGFHDQMERILVELDSVRGNLVSASAASDAEAQRHLAEDVRGLREEVGALAAGMAEAYQPDAAEPPA